MRYHSQFQMFHFLSIYSVVLITGISMVSVIICILYMIDVIFMGVQIGLSSI